MSGRVETFSLGRHEVNEDSWLVEELAPGRTILAVADGAGGEAAGARASTAAIERLRESVLADDVSPREAILRGFDAANRGVLDLGVGAATTLALVEIRDGRARAYHAGDSPILVVGQRGRRKLQVVAHSPVGFAVEAGLLDERDALHHEELHVVSNMVGSAEMRVEMSAELSLAPRDTVLVASDGLSDNLHLDEIVETIRKGPLDRAAKRLAEDAARRMDHPEEGQPSKPDDLTFLLYRPTA